MKKFLILNSSFLIAILLMVSCGKKADQTTAENDTVAVEVEETPAAEENMYIDFTAVTPEGKELSLSDLVGKTD